MGLQVWLPLNGSLNNQGLSNATITNNGATINTSGKIGNCYSFDGTDDYISITSDDLYQVFKGGTQHFTIAFWVYHNDSTRGVIFGDYGLTGAINFNIELREDHGIRFYWNSAPDKQFSDTVTAQGWTHIAIIYDGSKVNLYKNGVLSSDVYTGVLANKNKTSGAFRLGRDSRTGVTVFNGKLNDFRIYDTALSPREVKEISKGLVLHYPLAMPGQENLITNSVERIINSSETNNNNYSTIVTGLTIGETYTFSAVVELEGTDNKKCTIYNYKSNESSTGRPIIRNFIADGITRDSWTFTAVNSAVIVYAGVNGSTKGIKAIYKYAKLERGSTPTPWLPNPADSKYSALGFDDGIEYDVSGYGYNATIVDDVSYSSGTPRYNTALSLDGNGHINCGHAFHIQGALNISVSLWAYLDDWGDGVWEHFLSSEESGGIVVAKSSANGIRGRFNVYTAEDLSSHAYKQADVSSSTTSSIGVTGSGWHHIVTTYDANVGIKTYIDGVKRAASNFVSYGACFNATASMMLGAECAGSNNYGTRAACKLSDVRFYYTTLTDDDVLELYHTPISLSNNGTLLTQGEYVES